MILVLVLCILGLCISFFLANQFYEVAIEKGYDDRKVIIKEKNYVVSPMELILS